MKRTYDHEKKTSQSTTSVQPKATYLQTRGFAPIQTDLDENATFRPSGYTENFLEKLINQPSTESSDTPIQAKPMNRLKTLQAKRMEIQAKLNIGEPNDKYEKEADATASKVVQQINSPIQEQSVQRQESMEEDEELQMKSLVQRRENVGGGEASTDLESSIQSARGSGQSLDTGLQTKMGQAMGADFSGVKVHTDSQSDQLNQSIQAKAFTTGQDVFFRQGAYEPSSQSGQELIAHELTHVVQQGGGSKVQRKPQTITSISKTPKQIQAFLGGLFDKAKHTKLDDVKVTAKPDSSYGPNCGTEMLFEIGIDVPKKKKKNVEDYSDFQSSKDTAPFSINGLTLDYWEDIKVDYNFKADSSVDPTVVQNDKDAGNGSFHKPWNDIYAFRPIAPTFAGYGTLPWGTAVKDAAAGTLATGKHIVTVRDLPSLAASADKYMMRTLRFRVVLKDALGNSKEINATQILKMEDGVIAQNNYEDTAGNRIGVVGKANSDIVSETYDSIRSQLPGSSMKQIGDFYRRITSGGATPFNFFEADQAAAIEYPNGVPANLYQSSFMNTTFWYSILRAEGAGTYGLPGLKNGETYLQHSTGGNGLLVARTKGTTISKMYLTDGSTTDIKVKGEQVVPARKFTEIPPATIETFKDRV